MAEYETQSSMSPRFDHLRRLPRPIAFVVGGGLLFLAVTLMGPDGLGAAVHSVPAIAAVGGLALGAHLAAACPQYVQATDDWPHERFWPAVAALALGATAVAAMVDGGLAAVTAVAPAVVCSLVATVADMCAFESLGGKREHPGGVPGLLRRVGIASLTIAGIALIPGAVDLFAHLGGWATPAIESVLVGGIATAIPPLIAARFHLFERRSSELS